ncbi:hypothetical protein GCM10009765_63450 [Fodinicola feengrottensis]|uniref:Integral membrane protein n=1 Tax=Fodinicola feengrottensis TaxID=435914 RepID=A0ABN2II11_9ACTN
MNARTPAVSEQDLNHPSSLSAFRTVKLLVGGYLGLSVLTMVAVILLRDDTSVVTDAVWVRASIVTLSALLTLAFSFSAARGSRRGFLRLRLVSAIMLVAIAVIVALPGAFPVWLRVEQAVCGLLLAGVVVLVNGRHLRSLFATR